MKVKEVSLENFAKFGKVTVSFDDSLTYLIGCNGAGKTSVGITALWFILQGIAEKPANKDIHPIIGERFRFIGEAGAVAKGTLLLKDETTGNEIKVLRKLSKDGNQVIIESSDGQKLDQTFLNSLFNEFLIAPKRFIDLSAKEQTKALGIDTSDFDKKIADLKAEYTLLNRDYRNYGEIAVVEKVEAVDVTVLTTEKKAAEKKRQDIVDANKKLREKYEADVKNPPKEITTFNILQIARREIIEDCNKYLNGLIGHAYKGNEVQEFINTLPKPEPHKTPTVPIYADENQFNTEIAGIDAKIAAASETNTKANIYTDYLLKVAAKAKKQAECEKNQQQQKDEQTKKDKYLSERDLPFNNLTINEDGELLLTGKPIKEPYFSTGELLKIVPILISSQSPKLKYVFLQNFDLLDEINQTKVIEYLTKEGFQLVIEHVGDKAVAGKNSIVLKDCKVVKEEAENDKENLV